MADNRQYRKFAKTEQRGRGAYRGGDKGLPVPGKSPLEKGLRPGLAKSFMIPTKLQNQNDPKQAATEVGVEPTGKTSQGTTQWAFRMKRPGLAQPLIAPSKGAVKPPVPPKK